MALSAPATAGGALQSKESRLESLLSKSPICGPLPTRCLGVCLARRVGFE